MRSGGLQWRWGTNADREDDDGSKKGGEAREIGKEGSIVEVGLGFRVEE